MRRMLDFAIKRETTRPPCVPSKARGGSVPLKFLKPETLSVLAAAIAISAGPALAQSTQQQQTTTQTTTTTSATASAPVEPVTHHQLKKDEHADKAQAKADKAEAKAADSKKVREADQKQDQADRAAAKANSPY